MDTALSKANDTQRGIRWTLTDRLDDLDYADDICLLAHTFNDIRTKLQRLHHETAKVGLKININPYPTAFPYGNGMVLHFYQQQESSTTKTVHKVINKGLKAYV